MVMIDFPLEPLWAVMVEGQWRPGIGDPTWMGWLTVAAYFLTAVLCGACWFSSRRRSGVWLFLCVVLTFLGINKQLDLQSWFTEFGRQVALENGWYRQRREVQFQFIVALGLMAIAVFIGLGRLIYLDRRGQHFSYFLALIGLGFLACFVVVRAASFHHVDLFLRWQWAGLTMNGVLELSGIGLMAMGAMLSLQRFTQNRRP